jgi:hypothetical protein
METTVSNILKARVVIKGVRPLIQHRFGPDSIPLEKQEKNGVAGNNPEEWRTTAMVTPEGQLYLEPTYIFGCLRDGARHTKKGRGSIQALVVATLQILDDQILVDRYMPGFPNGHKCDPLIISTPPTDRTCPVYVDICSVRNPTTKGRNVRYRLATPSGWKTEFNIMWDKTIVDRNQMQSVINDAGTLCGLGDGRSVGFGRFQVESFEVID